MNEEAGFERDDDAVLRYIENFAMTLADAGIPRMPARVFVALTATDGGRLTAKEIADVLQISPAAVSGAVRHLLHVNLVSKQRQPGSRRDHYVVRDDVWEDVIMRRDQMLGRWEAGLREGVEAL